MVPAAVVASHNRLNRSPSHLISCDDGDRPISFEDCVFNLLDRFQILCSTDGHHILGTKPHALHDLSLPFPILQQNQRRSIDDAADVGFGFQP